MEVFILFAEAPFWDDRVFLLIVNHNILSQWFIIFFIILFLFSLLLSFLFIFLLLLFYFCRRSVFLLLNFPKVFVPLALSIGRGLNW